MDSKNRKPQLFPVVYYRKILVWVKLSNYGDVLKRLVLSYYRKLISGWRNEPGKVTSQTMTENEMGYRVSKSILLCLYL